MPTSRTVGWKIPDGERSITVNVSVPRKEMLKLGVTFDDEVLLWNHVPASIDSVKFDNEFRSFFRAQRQDVLVVSDPLGEMFLDDPAHHLKTSLEVLGFKVHRLDKIQNEKEYLKMPLWILLGGSQGTQSYCPSTLGKQGLRNAGITGQGIASARLPKIWLLPNNFSANYSDLCHCFHNLIEDRNGRGKKPLYCEELETRDQYISVLRSVGSQQVGGAVDDIMGSWAWHRKRTERKMEVLAFTVPLRPSRQIGLSYDTIPRLVKTFLQFSNLISTEGKVQEGAWPRLDQAYGNNEKRVAMSNVPRPESLMLQTPSQDLPPQWSESGVFNRQKNAGVKEEDDPRDWIRLGFWVIVGFLTFEVLWLLVSHFRGIKTGKNELIVLALLMLPFDGEAKVDLSLVGYDYLPEWGGIWPEMSQAVRVLKCLIA